MSRTNTILGINHIIQKIKNTIIKIDDGSIQISKTIIGILTSQTLSIKHIFSNHIHETNKHDKQGIIQRQTITTFIHKTQ